MNINGEVTLTGSKAVKIEVRGQTVAAGGFFQVGQFFAKDGIKHVTSAFRSVDSFDCTIYAAKMSETGILFITTGSLAGVRSSQELTSQEMTSGMTRVYFQNRDTSAHVIDVDAIGWAN